MENKEIIKLVKEIKSLNTLEELIKFISNTKKAYSCNAYKNGKEMLLLENDVNEQEGMSVDTIELKKKEIYHIEDVDGVKVHCKGKNDHDLLNETGYKNFIKFKIDINPNYLYKKVDEPELCEMDEDGKRDKFINEVSNQVEIEIYEIEIFA